MTAQRHFTDEHLHAYLDGEIGADEKFAIEAWLSQDREAAQRLRDFRLLNEQLKAAFAPVLTAPRTKELQQMVLARNLGGRPRRWQSLAAGIAIALVSGLAGFGLHDISDDLLRQSQPGPVTLADRAIGAHMVFVSEVRHPVEVAASEETHLIQWLTKRVGHTLKAPVLASHGYTLIGGRLLADVGRPAAQFMYEDRNGQRLTLYVRRDTMDRNTSFEFTSHNGVSAFTWIDAPLAYGLIGKLPREELQAIARITYDQLTK